MAEQIIFYILAIVIVVFSILSVSSRRILRSATYLLFVLLATAGLYLLMGYQFLFGVQISVYAGGIMVLYIFSILLTSHAGDKAKSVSWKRLFLAGIAAIAGLAVCGHIIYHNVYKVVEAVAAEPTMQEIGKAMMGTEKNQYLLPFEAIGVLLLACVIGGIMIARKR
ncbi:MAG: NADH-quinone oxidoreductase subunit J [Bacteroidales bacterium]|nr:NADH-quinone oxidoreductase subunit J [Bacteroidales bacterium]